MSTPSLFNISLKSKLFDRLEICIALLLTAWIVVLDFTVLMNAGALWRDEINGVNIASMATFSETWEMAKHDSFRMIWTFLLRAWIVIGAGKTDFGLRILGFLMGLGILGVLWFSARTLYRGTPLFSLTLLGLCPTVFIYANSLRTYGCSMIFVILTILVVWQVMEKPITNRIIIACIVAIMATQCSIFNFVLLLSTCLTGCIVAIMNKSKKSVLAIIGIGAISASSLLPYAFDLIDEYKESAISPVTSDFLFILGRFNSAIDPAKDYMNHVWVAIFLSTIAVCFFERLQSKRFNFEVQHNFSLFILLQLILGTICYTVFLKVLSSDLVILSWHFLPVLILMTLCFDAGFHQFIIKSLVLRIALITFVISLSVIVSSSAWNYAHVKMTNIDEIAAKISTSASDQDLVVVEPFTYGITFMRYYHGKAPWITIPDMNDHLVHRWDLAQTAIQDTEPLKSEFEKISKTLKSGNKIWFISDLSFLLYLQKAPFNSQPIRHEVNRVESIIICFQKMANFTRMHAKSITIVPIKTENPIHNFENNTLFLIQAENRNIKEAK
jgi:hypothetical protein